MSMNIPTMGPSPREQITSGIVPIVSDIQKRQPSTKVAEVSPAIYSAAVKTGLSDDESRLIETWAFVSKTHKDLMGMNNKAADAKYKSLAPEVQAALDLYYGVDYANKPSDAGLISDPTSRKLLGLGQENFGPADLKNPLKFLMTLGSYYYKYLNTPGSAALMLATQGGEMNMARLDDAYHGENMFDPEYANPLIEKYGGEKSFIAIKLLSGMTPGEIIDAWGPNDPAMIDAMSSFFNDEKASQTILTEFSNAQLSPGRMLANDLFAKAGLKPEEHKKLFSIESGLVDAIYQVAIDPMTYLTGGIAPVARGVNKLSKGEKAFDAAKTITEHFANPKNKQIWESFSGRLKEYADVYESGNVKEAARIRSEIRDEYPEFANDYLIQDMALNKDKTRRIVDVASAERYFLDMENASKLFRGRVDGITFAREGAMTMRRMRDMKTGIRLRTRELFKGERNFDILDDADVETFFDDFIKLGNDMNGGADVSRIFEIVDKASKRGVRGRIERFTSRAVGNKPIFTADEKFEETLGLLRDQAFISLGSKELAEMAAIRYSQLETQAERISFRKALDEMTMRRMGLDKVSGGTDLMLQILNTKYGFTLGGESYAASGVLEIPRRWSGAAEQTFKEVRGPLLPFQNTDAIGWLPMREIREFIADRTFERITSKADALPKLAGGILDHKVTNNITDFWSLGTLFPRLGLRTAIDEGFMFALHASGTSLKNLLGARTAGKIMTAYSGSNVAVGPVKSFMQRQTNKILGLLGSKKRVGALEFKTIEERLAMKQDLRDLYAADLAAGKKTMSDIEDMYLEQLLDDAIERFAGGPFSRRTLTPEEIQDIKALARVNPHAIEDISASKLKEVLIGRGSVVKTEPSMVDVSTLSKAMKDEGYEALGNFVVTAGKALDSNQLALAQYRNFYLGFATRPFKFTNGSFANPATIFIRRNGLATAADMEKATEDMMLAIGFIRDKGRYIAGDQNKINEFLNQSRHTLRDADAEQSAIALDYIESMFADLTFRFHGSYDQINHKLLNFFKSKADEAGNPLPAFKVVQDMTFEQYRDLVSHMPSPEQIRTDIDFSVITKGMRSYIGQNGIDKAWEAMSRQTDAIFRQPAVFATYMGLRKEYRSFEKGLADQYYVKLKEAMPNGSEARMRLRANKMADEFYTNIALQDSMNNVMKYADNPEVRSIVVDNYKNLGRFYRATEDFARRMYRLVKEKGFSATYRMRLMTTGLAAWGFVHTDDNDKSYVVMPMDDAFYHAVDTTLRTLSRDKLSVNQPLFNDITFKLSAGNPSFQDDAAVPYLSGPLASLSIMGVKALMGNFDATKGMAEDLDNGLLGNIGDNVTLRNAVVPRSIQLVWNMLSPSEQERQLTTATMQAIAYNQANGYGINPVNYQRPDGTVDEVAFERDKAQYLKDVQISAHNILWLRNVLGLLSPVSPTLQDSKDLPNYLKEVGVTSMKSSFFDVLDDVERMYPDADSHYELALGMWTGENRGKLAYMPSRNNADISVAMSYSYGMQDWILKHSNLVDEYGAAAIIFAPNTGEFSPGVYNWARAAGFLESADVSDYLDEVIMQDTMNAYFDLNDQETEALNGVASPDSRRMILDKFQEQRRNMMLAVPYLAERLQNMANNEVKAQFINNVYSIANMPDAEISSVTRDNINKAYDIYNNFITIVDSPEIKNANNSPEIKRNLKQNALDELNQLASEDQSGIVKQLIRIAFKGLMNAKSRDAQNTIR